MADIKRAWDFLDDKKRQIVVDQIIVYFAKERNEQIGVVAAGQVLDFFLEAAGGIIYNKALDDFKLFMEKELADSVINADVSLRKKE